jgi:hypothetical protein
VRLLPIASTPGTTNPDATRNDTIWEFKTLDSASGKNGTQNAIKQASAQGRENVLIELNAAYKIADVVNGLKAAFQPTRAKSIQQVDLMLPDGQTINFTANQLRNHSLYRPPEKKSRQPTRKLTASLFGGMGLRPYRYKYTKCSLKGLNIIVNTKSARIQACLIMVFMFNRERFIDAFQH